jgi:tetratricopeptide (TPR) repeat protein
MALRLPDPEEVIPALEKVRVEYPDTPAGRNAGFSLVSALAEREKYKEAATLLSQLADSLTPVEDSLRVLIQADLGGLWEDSGEKEKALECYRRALALIDNQPGVPFEALSAYKSHILSYAARLSLELGKEEEAKKLYRELALKYPNTIRGFSAKLKLGQLGESVSLFPELPAEASPAEPSPKEPSPKEPSPEEGDLASEDSPKPSESPTESPVASDNQAGDSGQAQEEARIEPEAAQPQDEEKAQ